MANVQITQLPAASGLTGTESVPIVQNGRTVQTTTGAIATGAIGNYTFLTATATPNLPNSRYFSTDANLTITDGGAQSFYRISLNGATAQLNSLATGFVVKTATSTLAARSIAVSGSGIGITNGSGVSGNPTINLSGLPLALANATGSGLISLNASTSLSPVTITGTTNQITVANGTGVGGNPTISISTNPTLPGNAFVQLPSGTTAQRGSPSNGAFRYNTETGLVEAYTVLGGWGSLNFSTGTMISFSAGTTGFTPNVLTQGSVVLDGTLNVTNGGTGTTTSTGSGSVVLNSNPSFATNITVNSITLGKGSGSGIRNVAFGNLALGGNTTGADNVALGYQAMYLGTTGGYNVALGYAAMAQTSTGSSNVAIGNQTLLYNGAGNENTAVGVVALYSNAGGNYNSALGSNALFSNTGSRNTGIGYNAGNAITSGSNNVILGSYTGNSGGLDIRTSSNNIILSDGAGNIRQTIDSTGNVGIRTTSPTTNLQVGTTGTSTRYQTYISGNFNFEGAYLGAATTNGGGALELVAHSNTTQSYSWKLSNDSDTANGALTFSNTGASSTYAGLSYSERMRIHATGGVSIGNTTDPGANNLRVTGGVKSLSQLSVLANGQTLKLEYAADAGSQTIGWVNQAGTTLWDIGGGISVAQDELSFRRQGTSVMYMSPSRGVSIGNTTDAGAGNLSVTGNATVATLSTNSTTSTTPVLSFNASNSGFASGATVVGGFLQTVLQNKSGTAGASTNYVVSNDLGTDSTYYGEMGMNASVYTASGAFADFYSINSGVYFSAHSGDISVGSVNGFKTYLTYASGASAHVINNAGALGFTTNLGTTPANTGTSGFGTSGQILTSAGSAAPPTWSSTATLTQLTVNGANLNTAISPTGTSTVTISPGGAVTLGTATVTTTLLGNISATTSNQTITLSPTGTGTVAISPVGALTINPTAASTINNTSIGATTASTGRFTTVTSTIATGTAPFTVASTTNVANLNASSLNGATFASPGAIGGTTAAAGSFTSLTATSRDGVFATNTGLTANTTVNNTTTYTTGGITLASQTAATGSAWRVRAFGQFTAASSATTRNAQIACFWGTTQLTAITPAVLISQAQTTQWQVEFVLTATSTTAIWTTGTLINRVSSATALAMDNATSASTTVTAGAQTLDLRVSMSTSVAGDSWIVQQVTIERLK
jgi:hypothetical protein